MAVNYGGAGVLHRLPGRAPARRSQAEPTSTTSSFKAAMTLTNGARKHWSATGARGADL